MTQSSTFCYSHTELWSVQTKASNEEADLVESTGFYLLIIARTWTDEHIYTYVNSLYLQHVITEAAHDVTSAQLQISKNTT